jgi:hypothetical protein
MGAGAIRHGAGRCGGVHSAARNTGQASARDWRSVIPLRQVCEADVRATDQVNVGREAAGPRLTSTRGWKNPEQDIGTLPGCRQRATGLALAATFLGMANGRLPCPPLEHRSGSTEDDPPHQGQGPDHSQRERHDILCHENLPSMILHRMSRSCFL